MLVQPATVARWQREGLRGCWSRRSRRRPGRPRIDAQVRALIRRMAMDCFDAVMLDGDPVVYRFAQGYEKQSSFKEGNNSGQANSDKVNWKLIDEAVKVAKESEVVIIFGGLNHDFDTESFDKQNIHYPPDLPKQIGEYIYNKTENGYSVYYIQKGWIDGLKDFLLA